jgi:hypothetical protein
VGKLVSLECAFPAEMWYVREQYLAMRNSECSGVKPDSKKNVKNGTFININDLLKEEWDAWIVFLKQNSGAPWKSMIHIWLNADLSSDASGRTFAGVVSNNI